MLFLYFLAFSWTCVRGHFGDILNRLLGTWMVHDFDIRCGTWIWYHDFQWECRM